MPQLYFSAIVFSGDINETITGYKKELQSRFGCEVALRAPAHITLVPPFRMHPSGEQAYLQMLDAFASGRKAFGVPVSRWSKFGKRTLFFEPQLTTELAALKKDLDTILKHHPEHGANADTRPFHPHITLANRDIPSEHFADAASYIASLPVPQILIAEGITTLKYGQKKWDAFHTSHFNVL